MRARAEPPDDETGEGTVVFSRLQLIGIAVLTALAAAGALWLIAHRPRGRPVELAPPATAGLLSVHVTGEVHSPGVMQLPPGSTVQDAIQAAGGATTGADLERLNLAARVSDGQQVFVPEAGQPAVPAGGGASLTVAGTPSPGNPINLNTATAEELEALPGIGAALASRIVEYRTTNGPFDSIEAIVDVPGIGPAKFEAIRELITVGP